MSSLLGDKTAVVTGGASGIGRGIALECAAHRADVVVADLQATPRDDGDPTHEVIGESPDARSTFVECNVTDPDDLDAAVEAAEAFGGIDVMVNNAGIIGREGFLDVDEEAFASVMDVNAKGVFFGSQAAGNRMAAGDGGSIINVSSTSGMQGSGNYVAYSASKGAVRLMSYAIAEALGPEGVRCNAVHPGPTETRMLADDHGAVPDEEYIRSVPLRRLANPVDIANVVVFLASDLSEYVTASSILVDGGSVNVRSR
jgi:NAD(P)-dependent dehydrogenase (short-subunit alcohol dehydrogenase family)